MLKRCAIFTLAFLGSLLLMDRFLQSAEIVSPLENRLHARIGPLYVPDMQFSRFSEGFFLGGSNEYGYLGRGLPRERQGDELRILLLGDSFTLGHTVFERHHFARTLEADLSAALDREVVVLNFARADFSLLNMYPFYLDYASQWDHDLTLYMLASDDLAPWREADPSFYPTCSVEGDSLRIHYEFDRSGKYQLYKRLEPVLNHTVIPRMTFNILKLIDRGDWKEMVLDKFAASPPPKAEPDFTGAPPLPVPEASLSILDRLRDQPGAVTVLTAPTYREYRQVLESSGLPFLDLSPALHQMQAEGRDPYLWPVTHTRGHWNHQAHTTIGHTLARQILTQNLLPPK